MSVLQQHRTLYILGAGFSRAISDAMPVTDELGTELQRRLSGVVAFNLHPGQSFEQWLTVQVTPLPFLSPYENMSRQADAARVISEIATILDECVAEAITLPCPPWLEQLVGVWNIERATVLTFNYDPIVEIAINFANLASRSGQFLQYGDETVFPAPEPPSAQYAGDEGVSYLANSMQILKMHGSLNWYRQGTDSKFIRRREKRTFGGGTVMPLDQDFSGIASLDRYLIPPVTSKEGYYSSAVVGSIWRQAGDAIAEATTLNILGYSLPAEDRVVAELISRLPSQAKTTVADRFPGQPKNPGELLGRLNTLGIIAGEVHTGDGAIQDFVQASIATRAAALEDLLASFARAPKEREVFVELPSRNETGVQPGPLLVTISDSGSLGVRATNALPAADRTSDRPATLEDLIHLAHGGDIVLHASNKKVHVIDAEVIDLHGASGLHLFSVPLG